MNSMPVPALIAFLPSFSSNSAQQPSTKARGGAEPMRAMTRSHGIFNSPSRVSKVISPLSIADAVVSRRMVIRPSASAASISLDVGVLGGGEIGRAVDDGDGVALLGIGGEAERILDAGVAGADHGDMLVDIFAGIVELILDGRALADRAADQVRIALGADGEDHRLGGDLLAGLGLEREIALAAGDRDDLGVELDVDLVAGGHARPRCRAPSRACPPRNPGPSAARAGSASP